MSPKASRPTTDPVRLLIEVAVGSGPESPRSSRRTLETLAAVFGVLAVAHLALTFALGQRPERTA